jgi:hypothetical protein
MPILQPLGKDEIANTKPGDRVRLIKERNIILLIVQVLGGISGLILVSLFFSETIEKLFGITLPFKVNELNPLISLAYAETASRTQDAPVHAALLKSIILSGICVALFIWFVWSLVTLYRSPNADAVGVATESTKLLGGFFIGALTGFLGS